MDLKFYSLKIMALTLMLVGCSQAKKQSVDEVLMDPTMRDAIMENISNDHQMMMNMMGHMMDNYHAMQMIMGNQEMMHSMMGNRQAMMNMMMQDSTISNMMMGNMLKMMEQDSTFGNRMTNMMMGNQHMMSMMQQKGGMN
ncbi:hypothetical protein [Allomuricauda sp. NBRC 101325]|uniref:hypothetical protein n=1 Tax=Allomuricauda sp. NBRC 101325 TaxID=1113758 RepID=UPI002553AF0A|nr:hypothetical protein [Muricauda sp. NBRC 101325]